jgi:hypothetical protein
MILYGLNARLAFFLPGTGSFRFLSGCYEDSDTGEEPQG